MKISGTSPLYLDTSALVKVYLPESDSDAVEATLMGRTDIILSDLAVTELTAALARRAREGSLAWLDCQRIYQCVLRDLKEGEYRLQDMTAEVHREAERLLMVLGRQITLRAADALHVALASVAGARMLISFDRRMNEAINILGTFESWEAGS